MWGGVADKITDIFENLLSWMFDSFIQPFLEIPTLKALVFGKNDTTRSVYGTFKPDELTEALNPLYYTMLSLCGFFLIAFIIIYGIRIAGAPMNPSKRTEVIDFTKDILFVGIVLVNLPTLYDIIFTINMSVVNLFAAAYDDESMDRMSNIGSTFMQDFMTGQGAMGILGIIFIMLVLLGLMLWANFYYMMRKVTLIILMALGPLALVLWLHPQFKPITGAWFKELNGSIFVQSIHAFVYWTIATLSAQDDSIIASVMVYIIFIPISEAVRRLFNMGGDMQGGFSKAGAMMGMAGLAGMYGSVKGALNGQSVMGAVKGAYDGAKNRPGGKQEGGKDGDGLKGTMGANAGSDDGTTPRAERMLKSGDVMGRAGKAVFGMAGAVAGSGLGPVGAMAGASGGFAAGGVVGGVTGRLGAAAAEGVASRFGAGVNAAKGLDKLKSKGFDSNLADEVANRETASWADSNKESAMAGLRERFPDASESEIASKFNDLKENKRAGFYAGAKSNMQSAAKFGEGKASGSAMVNASSSAMTNQWAADNEQSFNDDYNKSNPQQPGESNDDFATRRKGAFNNKKAAMKQHFTDAGNAYVSAHAADGDEPISKEGFAKHMSRSASSSKISQAASQAVDHVTGASMFDNKGKPNAQFLASGMANAKTSQMESAFVDGQMAKGVDKKAAQQDWNSNHAKKAHADNIGMYKNSVDSASNSHFGAPLSGNSVKRAGQAISQMSRQTGVTDVGRQAGAFLGEASGVTPTLKAVSGTAKAANVAANGFAISSMNGQGVWSSLKQGTQSGVGQLVEQQGGAVQAHANHQNKAGYAAGMVFGAGGYKAASTLANRISPYNKKTQAAIQSSGEVIQMARTTTDDHGNTQVAPGAIRQVTTPNESYIEVMTKSGERQVVSRKGAGHSGLRKGDVVYSDLAVDGDSLVGSPTSSYRLDSAGGRTQSSVEINTQPSSLLGNPRSGGQHQSSNKQQAPVYSQAVDSGQFYTNDLSAGGFENVQVVVEKGQQFMTANKDGMTYRVSPVYAGDSRLQGNQSVQVPVTVSNNKVEAAPTQGSTVAVQASMTTDGGGDTTVQNIPYYSTKGVDGLIGNLDEMMQSKHSSRADRSVDRRKALDEVRRKQGLLG